MPRWRVEWQAGGELVFDLPAQDINGDAYDEESISCDVYNACGDLADVVADRVFDELDSRSTDDAEADGTFEFTLTEIVTATEPS